MPPPARKKSKLETWAVNQLADLLDQIQHTDPTSYHQGDWGLEMVDHLLLQRFTPQPPGTRWPQTNCSSNACIAGWAVAYHGTEDRIREYRELNYGETMIPEYARELLGLSHVQYKKLFFNSIPYMDREPTPAEAARVLRHLAATGNVDWNTARLDQPIQAS